MSLAGLNLPWGRSLTTADLDEIPWRHASFELEGDMLVVTSERRPFLPDDLDEVPEDGHRYEVFDGVLFVSPAPRPIHQRAGLNLAFVLRDVVRPPLEVFTAPFDVFLPGTDARVEPDIVVAVTPDLHGRGLFERPELIVEVLSPSNRGYDLDRKKQKYVEAGCPHYWVVDPDEPSVLAWDLVDGEYAEAGRATGEEPLVLTRPFPVTVVPQRLIER